MTTNNTYIKIIDYCEVGMVSNKTFLPFSSAANAQDLLAI